MEVRGAPLIGATAAYGLVLSIIEKIYLKKIEWRLNSLKTYSNKFGNDCRSYDENC